MPKVEPTLQNVVMDPSVFGGPKTFQNVVQKNKYLQKYNEYIRKHESLAMDTFRKNGPNRDYEEVYFHFQLPSDNNEDILYDVVLRFHSDDNEEVRTEKTIANYHIEIFSNSPGFTFQYAYAYNKRHLLVEAMAGHYPPMALNTPPNKSNPTFAIGYDYTVFFALYYLKTNPAYLDKENIALFGTDINRFNPQEIKTSNQVYEERNNNEMVSFHSLERKAKKIQKTFKKKVDQIFGRKDKVKHQSGIKAKGARSTVKAKKASGGHHKRGFFK